MMRKIDQPLSFLSENKEMSAFLGAALVAGGALCCTNALDDHSEENKVMMVRDDVKPNTVESGSSHAIIINESGTKPADSKSETQNGMTEVESSPSKEENIEGAFRFSTFEVPAEGVLIEQKERGDDRESVIYILDYHTNSRVVSDYQRAVQTEIFEIVRDLVGKYEHVPVAMEVWRTGETASNYRRRSTDSANIGRLFSTSTLDRRMALVPSLMRDTKNVGAVIVGTFRDSVEPIGTIGDEDQQRANELVSMDRRLTRVTSDGNFCKGTDGRTYSFYDSRDAFRDGGSSVTDHCYCAVHEYEQDFVNRFSARLENEPKKEVRLALGHDGNFSVVIAGYKHWQSARDELNRQEANYVAISPRTLAPGLDEKLKEDYVRVYFPDSEDGRCDALRRENAQLLNTTLSHLKGYL